MRLGDGMNLFSWCWRRSGPVRERQSPCCKMEREKLSSQKKSSLTSDGGYRRQAGGVSSRAGSGTRRAPVSTAGWRCIRFPAVPFLGAGRAHRGPGCFFVLYSVSLPLFPSFRRPQHCRPVGPSPCPSVHWQASRCRC